MPRWRSSKTPGALDMDAPGAERIDRMRERPRNLPRCGASEATRPPHMATTLFAGSMVTMSTIDPRIKFAQ